MLKKTRSKIAKPAKPPTIKDFVEAFGLSKGRISQLWHEGMPREGIALAQKWYSENITQRAQNKPGRKPHTTADGMSKTQLECVILDLKAEALQRQKAKEEGLLVDTARVKQIIAGIINCQRRGYRKFEGIYAQRFGLTGKQRDELHKEWNEAEQKISKSISELAASLT